MLSYLSKVRLECFLSQYGEVRRYLISDSKMRLECFLFLYVEVKFYPISVKLVSYLSKARLEKVSYLRKVNFEVALSQ